MNGFIKKLYRIIVPEKLRAFRSKIKYKITKKKYKNCVKYYDKTITRLKRKDKIKVVFCIVTDAMWKLDELYWLMYKSDRFDPVIVICPWISDENSFVQDLLKQVEEFCIKKRYNYVNTFDSKNKQWIDIKKILNPDIIFFVQPYPSSVKKYRITNFINMALTCYVTYGFSIRGKQQQQFNLPFHNIMWKGFYETSMHKILAEKYADNKGMNVEVSGYPLFDEFAKLKNDGPNSDIWKVKDRNIKRIIWAPHHTINDTYNNSQFSCFLSLSSLMIELAEKYSDKIQIAFKPHPRLKLRLYAHKDWGITKTDEYYNRWKNLKNGQLEEGEYVNLFLTSDAMILDSVSFICEYLYTNNPMLFTMPNNDSVHDFNEFGELAFQKLYHSRSVDEIESFINEVIIKEEDYMKEDRLQFFNTQLLPPNNISASQNIFNYLIQNL